VGYPGGVFAPFIPGNLEELKVKEIKNGEGSGGGAGQSGRGLGHFLGSGIM
jgi:hypothetical protein